MSSADKTAGLDADLLSTLSDEERAAIEDADPKEIESLKKLAAGSDADEGDDEGDDETGGDDDEAADDEAAGAADGKADGADDAKADEAPAATEEAAKGAAAADDTGSAADELDDDLDPVAPTFSYKLPEDFEQRLADNKAAREAVYARLKGGEISVDELPAELDKLNDEAAELRDMRQRSEMAADMQRQAGEAQKAAAVGKLVAFAKTEAGGGIDYGSDKAAFGDLDTFVRALAAREENADKSLMWFLKEAHKRVLTLHGKVPAAAAPAAPAKPAAAAKPAGRKPPIDAAPKTLAQVPGGDGKGDIGGEFDDILSLEGEAFENALNAMARKDPGRFERFQAMH